MNAKKAKMGRFAKIQNLEKQVHHKDGKIEKKTQECGWKTRAFLFVLFLPALDVHYRDQAEKSGVLLGSPL